MRSCTTEALEWSKTMCDKNTPVCLYNILKLYYLQEYFEDAKG